jgi:hypothetical protein
MEENMVLPVESSGSAASTNPAQQTSISDPPFSASQGTALQQAFSAALAAARNGTGLFSTGVNAPVLAGGTAIALPVWSLWTPSNSTGQTTLGPIEVWPGGIASPTATNKAQDPEEPEDPNEAGWPAAQAQYYADHAQAYALVADHNNQDAQYDYSLVQVAAAVANPADSEKTDAALNLARIGAGEAAAGANAAQYAAFNAGVDADAAAAAANNKDYAEAVVQAGFARDAMVEAKVGRELTGQGLDKIFAAQHMLDPNFPWQE